MRVVLCDADTMLREMVESLIARVGHEIVGIVDTTVAAVGLIEVARPDLVVFDMTLGFNTDFDVIRTANAMGSRTVVFSHNADAAILDRYDPRPTVVHKPDLIELERVIISPVDSPPAAPLDRVERRRRPSRAASGPPPTNVADAQAFYEALLDSRPGDVLLTIDLRADGTDAAEAVLGFLRSTDRLVASPSSVRVLLPGGAEPAIESFLGRLGRAAVLPADAQVRHVVVAADETASQAFERLKH